jgi:glycine/D-amino acid oxidase-like deaminating enzyme/nitrite reductase/ring-hydroxylating ferredoxin subunit
MVELDTKPYWIRTAALPSFPALDRDLTVDVAVVGGGLTGISTAYFLKNAGLSVALLERGQFAAIDTGHTTAHLTMVTDLTLADLSRGFGRDTARAVWDAGRIAVDRIEGNIRAEHIACDFHRVPGYLHLALTGQGLSKDDLREQATLANELGFAADYEESIAPFGLAGARLEQQALFHPRKYLSGLLQAVQGDECHVYEHTEVDTVTDDLQVKAGRHTVSCQFVVYATHTPHKGKSHLVSLTLLHSKLAWYTTYALGGRLPAGRVPHALYWDTADPYHYLRVEPRDGFDYFVFGGADHKTGHEPDTHVPYSSLERTLRRVLPDAEITDRWSGQVIETNDGLPYIGELSPRQFIATGFAGNGMTFGTIAALMARDAVLGRDNPWKDLFRPDRTNVKAGAWDYVRENKDYLYYMLRDHVATTHAKSLRGLRPGQGRVVELNGTRVAAARDERGVVLLRSAVCTHMGCEVHWNQAEKTWDCPCHGSRFRTDGQVVSGPAESPLGEVET